MITSRTALTILLTLSAAGCLSDTVEPGAARRLITATPDHLRMLVGTTTVLAVAVADEAGTPLPGATVAFGTLDPTVATISAFGVVSAHRPGGTRVTVESAGSSIAVSVEVGLAFTQLAAGSNHTCGVTPLFTLYCWGANDQGQLGIGDRTDRTVPAAVQGAWTSVTAGDEHTCALTPSRTAYCWGRGSSGRLGAGNTATAERPTPVAGGHAFQRIVAGTGHTCGITTTGFGLCWGANNAGQIGDGSLIQRHSPVVIITPSPLRDISAGNTHTCAVDTLDQGWCWGDNARGQLAVDSVVTVPRTLPARAAPGLALTRVFAGAMDFTCGLTRRGHAWCWGRGSEGQLGSGATPSAQVAPAALRTGTGDTLQFTNVSVGWAHTCGRTATALMCWGTSRLGLPGLHTAIRPTSILEGADLPTAGFAHTCGRLATGLVACWGGGQRGALGAGDLSSSDIPRAVALQLTDPPG